MPFTAAPASISWVRTSLVTGRFTADEEVDVVVVDVADEQPARTIAPTTTIASLFLGAMAHLSLSLRRTETVARDLTIRCAQRHCRRAGDRPLRCENQLTDELIGQMAGAADARATPLGVTNGQRPVVTAQNEVRPRSTWRIHVAS
jgi:hypothetical protein